MKKVDKKYKVVIIGGGIVGAGIFRDLSLHKISCLLVDKFRFASQTSSKSSKMLHGGIRYLENLDFRLVGEALAEKNLWLKLAPNFTQEQMFLMPIYKSSKRSLYEIWAGIFLYDLLSHFQNSPCRFYSKKDVLQQVPLLKNTNLCGGGLYADAIVNDKLLNLAIINDAKKYHYSDIKENSEVINFTPYKNGYLVEIKYNDKIEQIFTQDLVIATGPFTDHFLANIKWLNWDKCLLPSKGSHLWIKKIYLNIKTPVVLTPKDGRIIFVIPHEHHILVGTTEEKPIGNFFDIKPSEHEITYLLNNLNEFFPSLNLTKNHIDNVFSGVRPLVKDDSLGNNKAKTSREHKVFNPFRNLHIIVGGKYTTFRVMGQEITQSIVLKHQLSYNRDLSKSKLIS